MLGKHNFRNINHSIKPKKEHLHIIMRNILIKLDGIYFGRLKGKFKGILYICNFSVFHVFNYELICIIIITIKK
ncbi:hypothetical protein PFBG_01048 [Plasmodium falciparum 7G8]|uniref:Uncharacterized protein n=2 Tax=Plasmodium falciparum TaxID=5833 RepID=A0A024VBJ2_PLAFA|nr:hypothetical protein PFFVO_01063 [Plasmodium falciparum Vietnam Oak-Knoll (FVO)]EUR77471.1 hypothetical protein PFBG_01048 [Plasmodium falciparum 7G8]